MRQSLEEKYLSLSLSLSLFVEEVRKNMWSDIRRNCSDIQHCFKRCEKYRQRSFLSQGLALTINGFDEGMKTKIMKIYGLFYG